MARILDPLDAERAVDRETRRQRRLRWPVARFRAGEEPTDDLSASTSPAQRIAMMAELAQQAWATAGQPWPSYTRAETPGRLVRAGQTRPDDDQ